jgi:hypothetical protein
MFKYENSEQEILESMQKVLLNSENTSIKLRSLK